MNTATFTYRTRIQTDASLEALLADCADLFGKVERSLFAGIAGGEPANAQKNDFLRRFDITARQFNAVRVQVQGKITAIEAGRKGRIQTMEEKLKRLDKTIQKLEKKSPGSNALHQKKRKRFTLQQRLESLKADEQSGTVRLCFGSKKLFHAQFHLEENGYASHEEWLADWQAARAGQFFVLGSKDETAGCQGCVATLEADGSITLRLRVPDGLAERHGRHVEIKGLRFAHGQAVIEAALAENLERHHLKSQAFIEANPHREEAYKVRGQALSYRFVRDQKGWEVLVTTEMKPPEIVTDKRLGVIGVDLNADHLAVAETDRFGNPIDAWRIPLVTYGKSQDQALALIGDAVAGLVAHAKTVGKPLVIEDLEFAKKKARLGEESPRYARMLSRFAYASTRQLLTAKGFREGVQIFTVNPAYTSVIGRVNYANRYGLSVHQAAALVIGRRFLRFSERPALPLDTVPDGRGGQFTFALPVRNRAKHVWSFWRVVGRNLTSALAAQARARTTSIPEPRPPVGSGSGDSHPAPCPVEVRHEVANTVRAAAVSS